MTSAKAQAAGRARENITDDGSTARTAARAGQEREPKEVGVTTLPYPAAEGREAPRAPTMPRRSSRSSTAMHARARRDARRAELDDLVQAASEQALKSLPSFEEGRAGLSTWIYRVCCYLTLLRARSGASSAAGFGASSSQPMAGSPRSRSARRPLTRRSREGERAARLRAALATLSPKRRAVVVLHDLERVPADEIAAIVGAKIGTVRSRLRDGRKDLARALREDPYFDDEVER